jgi:hypothetical protein
MPLFFHGSMPFVFFVPARQYIGCVFILGNKDEENDSEPNGSFF